MSRKLALLAVTAIAALSLLPQPVAAQGKKDSVVMAMALEPPGLDPTTGAAAAPLVGSSPGGSSAIDITTLSFLACAAAYCGSRESAAKPAAATKPNFLNMQTLLNGTDRRDRQTSILHYPITLRRQGEIAP